MRAFPKKYKLDILSREELEKTTIDQVCTTLQSFMDGSLKSVINATGVVLHTGMGRAPIRAEFLDKLKTVNRYSNLEIRLGDGKRGQRNDHLSALLHVLTGAEDGLAVNNNAAAVMLMLNTIGRKKEVIISRGELIEIGGSFRLPDVMRMSGCKLHEVGTTNKTHLRDYQEAISPATGAILICHPSNYSIEGFSQKPDIADIVALGKKHDIPVAFDLGSGSLLDTSIFGSKSEPVVSDMVDQGLDLISFSGDKLLGGPQAGIIVGKRKWIQKCKKNQLLRALRLDKFMIKLLQLILIEYLNSNTVQEQLESIKAITADVSGLEQRCNELVASLPESIRKCCSVIKTSGRVGSGAYPIMELDTRVISIQPENRSASTFSKQLRNREKPIFAYIDKDSVCLDLRTVLIEEIPEIKTALTDILS
jgi:L-seryl-tRNA(Ser) seleniumtransferase